MKDRFLITVCSVAILLLSHDSHSQQVGATNLSGTVFAGTNIGKPTSVLVRGQQIDDVTAVKIYKDGNIIIRSDSTGGMYKPSEVPPEFLKAWGISLSAATNLERQVIENRRTTDSQRLQETLDYINSFSGLGGVASFKAAMIDKSVIADSPALWTLNLMRKLFRNNRIQMVPGYFMELIGIGPEQDICERLSIQVIAAITISTNTAMIFTLGTNIIRIRISGALPLEGGNVAIDKAREVSEICKYLEDAVAVTAKLYPWFVDRVSQKLSNPNRYSSEPTPVGNVYAACHVRSDTLTRCANFTLDIFTSRLGKIYEHNHIMP